MECDRFVEEKLSGGETPEFREHLASCAGCARDAEEYAEVRRLYREASVECWKGGVPRAGRPRLVSMVPVAAAAVLMIGVLVLLMDSPGAPPPAGNAEPSVVFTRIHLEPWDRGEAPIARAVDDAWRRLEEIERRPR